MAESEIRTEMFNLLGEYLTSQTNWILIPFYIGGFDADSGLTGRKNVLPYGPRVPTGGGTFAGKDATKVDRSGAYWARKLAIMALKDLKLKECLIEVAFVIGKDKPIMVNASGIDKNDKKTVVNIVGADGMEVSRIIKSLDLRKPIFKSASWHGHFGNNQFNWEK